MKISKILYKESKWTKNALGRDKNGNALGLFIYHTHEGREYDSAKAMTQFSLYGAIAMVYGCDCQPIINKVKDAIYLVTGQRMTMAAFNNSSNTRFEDVKRVLTFAQI